MNKLEAMCCKCKEKYPQEQFARKDVEKKKGKLVSKNGKPLVCHNCGNGSAISNERRTDRVEDIYIKIERSKWESETIIESFTEHCKRLAEGNYQPWIYSN